MQNLRKGLGVLSDRMGVDALHLPGEGLDAIVTWLTCGVDLCFCSYGYKHDHNHDVYCYKAKSYDIVDVLL